MNKHYNGAAHEIGKANAMMEAVEKVLVDLDLLPEDQEKMNTAAYLFYAAWDAIKEANRELAEYAAECKIVDVLQTVREVHEL